MGKIGVGPEDEHRRLVEDHLGLARGLAASVWREIGRTADLDDLMAYGQLGLVEAAVHYRPCRNVKFSTFSYYRIRGAIYDGLRALGWAPVRAQRCWEAKNGKATMRCRDADRVEIYENLPPRPERHVVSLDDIPEIVDGRYGSVEDQLIDGEKTAMVRHAVRALPLQERQLLEACYYREMTITEAAAWLGLSKSWASRMRRRGLRNLGGRL